MNMAVFYRETGSNHRLQHDNTGKEKRKKGRIVSTAERGHRVYSGWPTP